jgi:predicted NAD-dependent protein-ADP-ribosyltransferase YbiA (DUF1768 family)
MIRLLQGQQKPIIVINSTGAYSALYNDSKYDFTIDSNKFRTFTHYYYYCISYDNKITQNNILKTCSTNIARLFLSSFVSNRISNYISIIKSYNSHKLCKMLITGLVEKFNQNSILKSVLLKTGDTQINYDCGNDSYLGIGQDGTGLNIMGVLMMLVRAKFRTKV